MKEFVRVMKALSDPTRVKNSENSGTALHVRL